MKLRSKAVDIDGGCRSICDYVRLRGVNDQDRVAYTFLHDPDDKSSYQRITYGELLERVIAFSARLEQAAMPGDRAIVLYPPGIDYIVAFSCRKTVPVPPLHRRHRGAGQNAEDFQREGPATPRSPIAGASGDGGVGAVDATFE